MIKTTKRDLEIIALLNKLKVLSSTQLQRLFFNGHSSHQSRRCKQLVNHKKIKVYRKSVYEENIYYLKSKPRQQEKSMLLLSEFYTQLIVNEINVVDIKREYTIEKIRADAFITIEKDGFYFDYLIEVDLTHWNGLKYLKVEQPLPPIISISPYKRSYPKELEVYYVNKDFSNLCDLLSILC